MNTNNIKVQDIDEDFVDIIDRLIENGFRPWASCDGVKVHHTPEKLNEGLTAYIAFLNSDKILQLFSAFKKDVYFELILSNQNSKYPKEMYGNIIEGNKYSIHFKNLDGEYTKYFDKIINYVILNNELKIDDDIDNISKKLDLAQNSQIAFEIGVNVLHPAYYNDYEQIKTNSLTIYSKEGYESVPNINELMNMILKEYNLDDLSTISKEDKNFVFYHNTIYSDNIKFLQDIMEYCLKIEPTLSKQKSKNDDDIYYDEENIDNIFDDYDCI